MCRWHSTWISRRRISGCAGGGRPRQCARAMACRSACWFHSESWMMTVSMLGRLVPSPQLRGSMMNRHRLLRAGGVASDAASCGLGRQSTCKGSVEQLHARRSTAACLQQQQPGGERQPGGLSGLRGGRCLSCGSRGLLSSRRLAVAAGAMSMFARQVSGLRDHLSAAQGAQGTAFKQAAPRRGCRPASRRADMRTAPAAPD